MPRARAIPAVTATVSRKRPTSLWPALAACGSTTKCGTSGCGTSFALPEVVRAFEAGPDGLELIAVGGPKPEGGDGVRSETPWPDAGES
jgi:hypothetical protein